MYVLKTAGEPVFRLSRGMPQSNSEYYWTFVDRLEHLTRKAFKGSPLYFVTYQPPKETCLFPDMVTSATERVFGHIPFVIVVEQTFKVRKFKRSAEYLDNWHSHLIIDQDGLSQLTDLNPSDDIVIKPISNLEDLILYLAKQAPNNRILPTYMEPAEVVAIGSEETPEPVISDIKSAKDLVRLILFLTKAKPAQPLPHYESSICLQRIEHQQFLPNCPPPIFDPIYF